MNPEISALIAELGRAFARVPKGMITIHEAELLDAYSTTDAQRKEARSRDQETRWEDIPDSAITECGSALCFLDPPSWLYHLPAYIRWSLLHLQEEIGPVVNTVQILNGKDSFSRERLQLLSDRQLDVVCKFLQFIIPHLDEQDAEDAQDSMRAIRGRIFRDPQPS